MTRSTSPRKRNPSLVHVYVPETFCPKTELPVGLQKHSDSARYLLHRIIWGSMMRKKSSEEFVPLKFDYLRAVIPDRVIKPLRKAMEESGTIETDGFFIEGRKAFGYRLGQVHAKSKIIRLSLTDDVISNKIETCRKSERREIKLDVHKYLRKWYEQIEVDLPLAMSLLKKDDLSERAKLPIEQIAAKEFSFSFCRFGRIHTDLTRFPSLARPALRFHGEPLVSLDIANSQPLFLCLLLINYRKAGNKIFNFMTFDSKVKNPYEKLDEIIAKTVGSFGLKEENNSIFLSSTSNTTRKNGEELTEVVTNKQLATVNKTTRMEQRVDLGLRQDEADFIRLCESGELYAFLKENLEVPRHRKWVKEDFFAYLFGRNSHRSELKSLFAETFPHVAKLIKIHKQKDHAHLPNLLTNIESTFIINIVCRRLMNQHPAVPVFTIHDSILTTKPHVEQIRSIVLQEFENLVLTPTLHVTEY